VESRFEPRSEKDVVPAAPNALAHVAHSAWRWAKFGFGMLWTVVFYVWLSTGYIFFFVARGNRLTAFFLNSVIIVALLVLYEWLARRRERGLRRPTGPIGRFFWWLLVGTDGEIVSWKASLYLFYVIVLVVRSVVAYGDGIIPEDLLLVGVNGAFAVATPSQAVPSEWMSVPLLSYLDLMAGLFMVLVALDKLAHEFTKSARRARDLEALSRRLH
jgi:hypothetical protein